MLKRIDVKYWAVGVLFIILVGTVLAGCSADTKEVPEKAFEKTALSVIVGTDLHYLSPTMTDHGALFTKAMAAGDGKYTAYCEEITDAFFEEVKEARPEALILSGDLTFNGEANSHKEMVEKLQALQDLGIAVLVLPGNHDIDYPYVYKYEGDEAIRVEGISSKTFKKSYRAFGYDQAMAQDASSLSYVYELAEDLWILLLDSQSNGANGAILPQTLSWAEEQLQKAQDKGIKVMTVTHENLLMHHELVTSGFVLENAKKVLAMLQAYGVSLNLSGHIHIQHMAKEDGLIEITTSALSVSPHQYGVLEIGENRVISFEVKATDVATYAKDVGIQDPILLDFSKSSREYFNASTRSQVEKQLKTFSLSQEEITDMAEFAAQVNAAYFSGRILEEKEAFLKSSSWVLWEKYGQKIFFGPYLKAILEEVPQVDSYLMQELPMENKSIGNR